MKNVELKPGDRAEHSTLGRGQIREIDRKMLPYMPVDMVDFELDDPPPNVSSIVRVDIESLVACH